MDSANSIMFMVLFFVTMILFGPLLVFWCFEVLFDIHIPLTLRTWAAANIMVFLFRGE